MSLSESVRTQKYAWTFADGSQESWEDTCKRVVDNVTGVVSFPSEAKHKLYKAMVAKKFLPGGRYLSSSGRPYHQTQNCLLLKAEDSREGWGELAYKATMALMSGAGIGVDYSGISPEGKILSKTGGVCSGPIPLMKSTNEQGRGAIAGGHRRAAIWAGLNWKHRDIHKFISLKDWPEEVKALKEKDFNFPATMDFTNISVLLDDAFFQAINSTPSLMNTDGPRAMLVYWDTVRHMLMTGEPGFSIDVGENAGETLRNACTEITSRDDSDICNLGSINMARVKDIAEFRELTELGIMFLLAGTVYSDVPYEKVAQVREKNRRLGLGLMGMHEWLLVRGYRYEMVPELDKWLSQWAYDSSFAGDYWAGKWGLSLPVKTRAIAPTGSIAILGETTSGIEPIFCTAYKRRYKTGLNQTSYQYVLDPTAKRLIENGIHPDAIEDAYTLAEDVERRLAFQAEVQKYVDHSISSTINLPPWGSELNNESTVAAFGGVLMKYLPKLRGITVYPDGARGGQPLVRCPWDEAMKHQGQIFVEQADVCDIRGGGSCGA